MHVDLLLNHMISYRTADESAHFHYITIVKATIFGNLQPEIEISEYSSSKKLLE